MEAHTHTHTHTCDQTHTSPTTNHLTPYPSEQPKNNTNNSCGIATLFVCYVGRSTWHGRLAAPFCLWSCVTAVCSHLSCVGVRVGCNYAKPYCMQPSCAFALVVRAHHLHLCVVVAAALAYSGCAIWGRLCFSVPRMGV